MTIFQKLPFFGSFSCCFFKWDLAESWGFLRCNQCIKTLHLSYQTPPYDDFHFSTYNGFLEIFRPLVGGSKINFENFEKYFYFYYGKRHLKPPAPEKVWNSPPITYSSPYNLFPWHKASPTWGLHEYQYPLCHSWMW